MFNNPGKKIKTLAKVLYWIIALGSLATAILFVAENSYWGLDIEIILIAVAIVAGGYLAAFLSNLGLYAFGELVENSSARDRSRSTARDCSCSTALSPRQIIKRPQSAKPLSYLERGFFIFSAAFTPEISALYASTKSSLPPRQRGHSKSSGMSSHLVPGAMPSSGQPTASSYSQPQTSQICFM